MLKEYVSEFVKEAPPYNFGVGEKHPPLNPGVTEIIKLNKNENPFGVSPLAQSEMRRQIELSNRYSDPEVPAMRERIARLHNLTSDNVLLTPGATSGLGFLGEVFIRPGDEIIVTSPSYPNYYNVTKKAQGVIVDVPMPSTFIPDFNEIMAAITPKTKMVFLCNPNNPTGTICDADALFHFIRNAPSHIIIVVDEAYFEFIADPAYPSTISLIDDNTNLIVVKTFSKIYGLAGARVGYLLSNPEIISYLSRTATGYFCSRVGMMGAMAAMDDTEFVNMTISENKKCRDYLIEEMKALGFDVWPSYTNFIFFKPTIKSKELADKLYSYGIQIRGDFTPYARISIGTMEQCKIAVQAMKDILK